MIVIDFNDDDDDNDDDNYDHGRENVMMMICTAFYFTTEISMWKHSVAAHGMVEAGPCLTYCRCWNGTLSSRDHKQTP